jgi:hypothetical protein
MAVKAKEVTMDLHAMKDAQDAVTEALEQEGFKADSVAESENNSNVPESSLAKTVLVLREGHVCLHLARAKNTALLTSSNLWSSFNRHEATKRTITASVGDEMEMTLSHPRIVAGGTFGVSTWKDDAKVHGPQTDELCNQSKAPVQDACSNPSMVEVALEAALRLLRDEDPIIAAVVCGDSEACATIDQLKKNGNVGQQIVLTCPELKPGDELFQERLEHASACEKKILKTF